MSRTLDPTPHLLVAPVTPMDTAGTPCLSEIATLSSLLIARGANGFYVTGGTGEGMLLSVRERMSVVERWCEAVDGEVPVIVHVGCVAVDDAKRLARHAEELGVAAISAIAPPVYLASDVHQLVASLAEVADAAPATPFYFYHNSAAPGPKVSGFEFLAAASGSIATLRGIKFTHEDLFDLSRCLRFEGGRYRIFYGKDEFMLGAHAVGAQDFIGGSYNVVSPLVRRSIDAFARGDIAAAQAAHHSLVDVIAVLRSHGGLPAVKAAVGLLGVPCGACRLPLRTLTPRQIEALAADLRGAWPEFDAPTAQRESRLAAEVA